MVDLKKVKIVCENAIKKAGIKVKEGFYENNKNLNFKDKSHTDYLTKYDNLSQTIMVKEIKKNFPEHNFLGEEKLSEKTESPYCWVIDPIDGTRPFSRGIPTFQISLSFVKDNKTILCCLHNPVLDELFFAQKGKGTYLNNKKITVSDIEIKNAHLEFVSAHHKQRKIDVIPELFKFATFVNNYHSQCYSISLIASARHEGMIAEFGGPWDYASYLLVEEAGGKVTDFNGDEFDLSKNNIIISNGKIHEDLIKFIKKHNKK